MNQPQQKIVNTGYEIFTRDNEQRELWQLIFNQNTLPVVHPFPHPSHGIDGVSILVFSLAVHRLEAPQVWNLASYISNGDIYQALDKVQREGYLISAEHCELVRAMSPQLAYEVV